MRLEKIREFISQITCELYGVKFYLSVEKDKLYEKRIYLQVLYRKPGEMEFYKGGKHYPSPFMIEDEIVKKAYKAFKDAVEYEIMRGFKFNGTILINPHVNYKKLLEISPKEVNRQEVPPFDF